MELHQKTLLEKRSFYLLSNKLKLYLKSGEGEYENYISYESLTGETKICCQQNLKLLFVAIALLTFSACILLQSLIINQGFIYSIVPLIIAFIAIILYQNRQQNYLILATSDRQKVIFLRDKPNRQALDQFLAQLWIYRKKYLREKYFYINYNHDLKQQTERLRWLLEQNVISKAEYRFAQEDWIIDRSYQAS
ncbi:hypothetical protein C7B62_19870 [Pleurocapsa sp. CCALA 161]|uniref:hypothetical protein n=1 Tax=Pleurocapsa sp. CCALA 161 TaxID=2107688 RepID=UPI000D06FECD|nr:hypothetical protein [Pleurocapsa sp. CCALA 161]PSB07441.1 hypothetical protein C7B62_19870 [Pleurocapsa sp. CCALA 161]